MPQMGQSRHLDHAPLSSGLARQADNPEPLGTSQVLQSCRRCLISINLSARFRSSHQSEFGGFVLPSDTGYYIAGLYTAPPSDHVCASVTGSFCESLATNPEAAHMRAARACMAIRPGDALPDCSTLTYQFSMIKV